MKQQEQRGTYPFAEAEQSRPEAKRLAIAVSSCTVARKDAGEGVWSYHYQRGK